MTGQSYQFKQIYSGKAGDYFDFRTDRKVYIKEGPAYDTLNYQLANNYNINLENFGFNLSEQQLSSTIAYSGNQITISGTNSIIFGILTTTITNPNIIPGQDVGGV